MRMWLVSSSVLAASVLAAAAATSAGEGLVALNTCEASCPDDSTDRYVDCGNGTVTDNTTGLVWLANADCFGSLDWYEAMAAVAGLSDLPDDGDACDSLTPDECDCGLSDGSSPGEWRLPSIEEWEAMVKESCTDPAIANDAGGGCWSQTPCVDSEECSFYGVKSSGYWSSSSRVSGPSFAWEMTLFFGLVRGELKTSTRRVWPVRGGQ